MLQRTLSVRLLTQSNHGTRYDPVFFAKSIGFKLCPDHSQGCPLAEGNMRTIQSRTRNCSMPAPHSAANLRKFSPKHLSGVWAGRDLMPHPVRIQSPARRSLTFPLDVFYVVLFLVVSEVQGPVATDHTCGRTWLRFPYRTGCRRPSVSVLYSLTRYV